MKLFLLLVPIWLVGIILPSVADPDNLPIAQFGVFVWLPIIGVIVAGGKFLRGPIFRESLLVLFWAFASVLAILASAVLSEDPMVSLGFVATAGLGLACCGGIWQIVGRRMGMCLALYAIFGSLLAAYAYVIGNRVQGRLMISDAHPNFLGVVCFGVLMCCLTLRPWPLAVALALGNFFIIIETQSRSALGAAFIGCLIYIFFHIVRMRWKVGVAITATCGIGLILSLGLYDGVIEWLTSVFFVNDRYRGLGTGFTGRVGAWQEAIDLFQSNPVFGVGFRMHERYMTLASSAHNGYLSMLAEGGAVGALTLFTLTAFLCWRLMRRSFAGDRMAILGISLVLGYLFIAAFERLFLNMGNPTSVLAWLFLLLPSGYESAHVTSVQLHDPPHMALERGLRI